MQILTDPLLLYCNQAGQTGSSSDFGKWVGEPDQLQQAGHLVCQTGSVYHGRPWTVWGLEMGNEWNLGQRQGQCPWDTNLLNTPQQNINKKKADDGLRSENCNVAISVCQSRTPTLGQNGKKATIW